MSKRFIRYSELREEGIPFSRKHVRALEMDGKFPRRVSLGENTVAWIEGEIDEWAATRPRVTITGQLA